MKPSHNAPLEEGPAPDSSQNETPNWQAEAIDGEAWDRDAISTGSGVAVDMLEKLLESHPGQIPFHDPRLYVAKSRSTRSVANFQNLAFPDLWGHQPPPSAQSLLKRKHGVQR